MRESDHLRMLKPFGEKSGGPERTAAGMLPQTEDYFSMTMTAEFESSVELDIM
jgi:hypothetical protein